MEELELDGGEGALFEQAIEVACQAPSFVALVRRAYNGNGCCKIVVRVNNDGCFPSGRYLVSANRIEINTQKNSTLEEQLSTLIFEIANAVNADQFDNVMVGFRRDIGKKGGGHAGHDKAKGPPAFNPFAMLNSPERAARAYEYVEYGSCVLAAAVQAEVVGLIEKKNGKVDRVALMGHAPIVEKGWEKHWSEGQVRSSHRNHYVEEFKGVLRKAKQGRLAKEQKQREEKQERCISRLCAEFDRDHIDWRLKLGVPPGALEAGVWYPVIVQLDRNREWLTPQNLANAERASEFRTKFIPRAYRQA